VVEVIQIRLSEQKDILVGLRATIPHGFGHWIGFIPDDILPQPPTIGLERKRNAPRDTNKVFRL
jgi:hypothetical protein